MSLTSQVEALNVSSHTRGEILRLGKCVSIDQRADTRTKLHPILELFLTSNVDQSLLRSIFCHHLDLILNPPSGIAQDVYDTEADHRVDDLDQLFRTLQPDAAITVRHTLREITPQSPPSELAIAQMIWVLFEDGIEVKGIQEFLTQLLAGT